MMGYILIIIIIIYLIIAGGVAAIFQKMHEDESPEEFELMIIGILWPVVILIFIVGSIMNIGYWITKKIIK